MTPLQGLILAGGRSSRMGDDKAGLTLCGEPELEKAASALRPFCGEIFVSLRPEQTSSPHYRGYSVLTDPPGISGPMAGIAAALRSRPESAWLCMAVDMPYISVFDLELLITKRETGREASCFYNEAIDGPEPLLTIFEPSIAPRLEAALAAGHSSLFRLLSESDVALVSPGEASVLRSINTPEEYYTAQEALCHDD